jgi:cell division protease FtsH
MTNDSLDDGRDEAGAYLSRVTRPAEINFETDFETDADLSGGDDSPHVVSATPDQALDMMLIMRTCRVLGRTKRSVLRPSAGTITVIAASALDDRRRLATLLPDLAAAKRGSSVSARIHFEGGPAFGRSTGSADLVEKVEGSLLNGKPVIAITARPDGLPDIMASLIGARLTLPRPDSAMLSAVLSLLHKEEIVIDIPDAEICRLTSMQLIPVFATRTSKGALRRLRRILKTSLPIATVTLSDVHGQPVATAALGQTTKDMEDWRNGKIKWSEVTRSFLLIGPPGTGKTLLAHGLAGSAGLPLIKTSYGECQKAGHQGDMLRVFYAVVELVIASAPAIFLVDEIDSFYARDRSQNGYIIGVVNALLTALDRLHATEGVILIAATNDLSRIDSAVVRAGRFDRHLKIGLADRGGIRSMLGAAADGTLSDVQMDSLCDQLLGATGADIAALIRDARTRARAARRPMLAQDVQDAADGFRPRPEPRLIRRIAVHEAGHLLVNHLYGLPSAVSARITPNGGEVLRVMPPLLTQASLRGLLCAHLAGRAAEDVMLNDISSGSGGGHDSDLAQATRLALNAEIAFGFGPSLTWLAPDTPLALLPAEVRVRVETALQQSFDEVRDLLSRYKSALDHIATELEATRELDQPGIVALLAEAVPNSDHTEAAQDEQ